MHPLLPKSVVVFGVDRNSYQIICITILPTTYIEMDSTLL
jgi:hypothetical protein